MSGSGQHGKSPSRVKLCDVQRSDLEIFFQQQLDPVANQMAAFTSADPASSEDFMARWERIMSDNEMIKRTVVLGERVIGHVVCFQRLGKPEITYWFGREYWGQGLATEALQAFLRVVQRRPLYARAAADNGASLRVLEKCGFVVMADERAYANARGEKIDELILKLS
ncbi:MAG: GNAT family N-acetyltransferase [Candidatus Promineifilaceae bacterium]|nr:GNAT family N-acetyltransferase [Candidatus Promineifilaceae bacterium]